MVIPFRSSVRLRSRFGYARSLSREDLFARAAELAPYFQEAVHSLADCKNVIDVRNLGLMGAIELESIAGKPTVGHGGISESLREGASC